MIAYGDAVHYYLTISNAKNDSMYVVFGLIFIGRTLPINFYYSHKDKMKIMESEVFIYFFTFLVNLLCVTEPEVMKYEGEYDRAKTWWRIWFGQI